MNSKVAAFALMLVTSSTSVAADRQNIDAKLSVEIHRDGQPVAKVTMTNNTDRSVCILPGWHEVHLLAADGKWFGTQVEYTLLWPDEITVIWNDQMPHEFELAFNPPDLVLKPNEIRQATRAETYIEGYDCQELVSLGQKAHIQFKLSLDAIPTKE